MPAGDSSDAFKELAAQAAGEKWLTLLDRGEYAKAWEECAQLFRQRVTRQQWIDTLPSQRGSFGPVKSRKVEVAGLQNVSAGRPRRPVRDGPLSNKLREERRRRRIDYACIRRRALASDRVPHPLASLSWRLPSRCASNSSEAGLVTAKSNYLSTSLAPGRWRRPHARWTCHTSARGSCLRCTNQMFAEPVSVSLPGRNVEGSTQLTPFGERVIALYRAVERRAGHAAAAALEELSAASRPMRPAARRSPARKRA